MEQEIKRTVTSRKDVVERQEKELEEQTGIAANLEEDEMKNYLEKVMQEVGKAKKTRKHLRSYNSKHRVTFHNTASINFLISSAS